MGKMIESGYDYCTEYESLHQRADSYRNTDYIDCVLFFFILEKIRSGRGSTPGKKKSAFPRMYLF